MEKLNYDFDKTVQAAGVLLGLEDGQMGRMRLLKLLYIAERELLAEEGRPLLGDTYHALPKGPVAMRTYQHIKGGGDRRVEWQRYHIAFGYRVKMVADPGRGKLSRCEIDKLNDVSNRFRDVDDDDLSDLTHFFKEYDDHKPDMTSSAHIIPWTEILEAQGRSEMVEIIREHQAAREYMDELFGG